MQGPAYPTGNPASALPPPPGMPQVTPHGQTAPAANTVEQRMHAEIRSLQAMSSTLTEALRVFTSQGGAAARAEQTTMNEVCELLSLIVTVLQQDPNVGRLKLLLFDSVPEGTPNVFAILFQYLASTFTYAPGAVAPEEAKNQINRLRNTALRTLSKVVSLASFDHYPAVPETAQVSQWCAQAVVDNRGVQILLSIVCGGPQVSEESKISAVECLFVFVMRNAAGKQAIVDTEQALMYVTEALRTEKSPMVRNYSAACIRELANTHPSNIIHSEFPELVVELIRNDSSADVRVLSIETLDVVLKADSSYIQRYPCKKDLAEVLLSLLEHDTNKEVVDITCRLLSTLFTTEGRQILSINHKDMTLPQLPVTFTTHWIDLQGYVAMLGVCSNNSSVKVAGMASRAFRHLIQYAPWQVQLGHRLIENWNSVGVLLKALQPSSAPKSDDLEAQIPLVELSIALGLLFAQSPYTRTAIHRELSGFPAWLPSLRSGIINHLNRAALEYYSSIEIFDITGHQVNSLQGMQWNDAPNGPTQPKKASIRNIFLQQEQRVSERLNLGASRAMPVSTAYDDPETQHQKAMRLTFVVVVYGIHLALSPGGADSTPAKPAEAHPAGGTTPVPSAQPAPPAHLSVPPSLQPQNQVLPPRQPGASVASSAAPLDEHPRHPSPQRPPSHVDPALAGIPPRPVEQPFFSHYNPQQPQSQFAAPIPQPPPAGAGYRYPSQPPDMGSYQSPAPGYDAPRAGGGPMPTRSSLLRERYAHPDRAEYELMKLHASNASGSAPSRHPPAHGFTQTHPRDPVMSRMHPGSRMSQAPNASGAYEPMFPSASGPPRAMAGTPAGAAAPRPGGQDAELRQTYTKFDNALRLTIHFAQYFNRKVERKPTYKATPDGYMIRQSHLVNPWVPLIKKNRLKTWSIKDLKEGDLFYFAVPFNEISVELLEQAIARARKHLTNSKKLFLITPQRAKGRRWFLFDLLNNIVPRIQDVLMEMVRLLQNHGQENIKFPLFMFREPEMNDGERVVHPGNILDIVDQIKFYFAQSPNDLAGVNSNYIRDLDERMKALASREFTGYEDGLSDSESSSISSDDSDAGPPASGVPPGAAAAKAAAAGQAADDNDDSHSY
eukprot:TRINITY_DN12555_c0_g1_i1.p1 TRINITY_DN12555_c0_g1~~TRINITY_DN12555_c0_g1_i1.p1  ORF type:complete len:1118 (+),score=414.72 TRINITY_DN12555_c0_g1_i1:42-3395(+)